MSPSTPSGSMLEGMNPKAVLFMGFLAAFSILSLAANVVLGVLVVKGAGDESPVAYGNNAEPSAPAAPTQPAAPLGPQTFEITKANHVRGNFNAPVTLVEFSDFECPFCGRHHPTMKQVLDTYKDKVRIVYKHFPLNFHPNAQKAAEASECAAEQNKFWEMHDKMFENQTTLSVNDLKNYAAGLGLNAKKFNDCLDSGKMAAKVTADYQEGLQKGVEGTPATYVNGTLVSGAQPFENFKQLVDQELNK